MSSPSPQSELPSPPSITSSTFPRRAKLTPDGQRTLAQLERAVTHGLASTETGDIQTLRQGRVGTGSLSHQPLNDAAPVSSTQLPKMSLIKRLARIFKGELKRAKPDHTAETAFLRLDIFSATLARATPATDLPEPCARIDNTSQLVYCRSVLERAQHSVTAASGDDDSQGLLLNEKERKWANIVKDIEKDHICCLLDKLVNEFVQDQLKASSTIVEIVLIGPVLNRDMYRNLLACFISKFEKSNLLDLHLLQGLVQLVECASLEYLVDNDMVRIATVLSKELEGTHTGNSYHPLYLTWALSRVLDVMVAGKVKDLNRKRDHQPMRQLLKTLKDSSNTYLKRQAVYAYQALLYAPDDETPLQAIWRYTHGTASIASAATSVLKLDLKGFLDGVSSFQEISSSITDAIKTGVDVVRAVIDGVRCAREGAGTATRAAETRSDFIKKRSWYLALQGTALLIRQGRLVDVNQVVSQAACRHDINFQWGICRQLGEIAVDPLWDSSVRQQAVEFLGELYYSNSAWKPHVDVKQFILSILNQVSELPDVSVEKYVAALPEGLKGGDPTKFPGFLPLSTRLPVPTTFPLLALVQKIPEVDYSLHSLKVERLKAYKQPFYIAPMVKPDLDPLDNTPVFPLLDKAKDFLASDSQVMLILGDSGAGKSTFNLYLENKLWKDYKTGSRIPLFIDLPDLHKPEEELVAEKLKTCSFTEGQIQELKLHRQFILICDGFDESQLKSNLHTTNLLNRPRQWDVKLVITCRSQYLGRDYLGRFIPKTDRYHCASEILFQQVVIAPFSRDQIEEYVGQYVPLEPRTWVKKDYMDKLTAIPSLMGLVKNPLLLSLCLEALPRIVQNKTDLSRFRVTRVLLYDNFVQHWLEVEVKKRRMEEQRLDKETQSALEDLQEDGFKRNVVNFQIKLAAAIFREQEGQPVVNYNPMRDKKSWKADFFSPNPDIKLLREASVLSRVGTTYRFLHRSVLEYFFSCRVWGPDEFSPPGPFNSSDLLSPICDHLLSQKNLIDKRSIYQFLAERVQLDPNFKLSLVNIIELSKTDEKASQAAAVAITILVTAGVQFNGQDLQGIRIPGADVSGGQFDSVQFQDADLTDVNLTRSWIRQANFSGARMKGVKFGEVPYLKGAKKLKDLLGLVRISCAYSPDGSAFAIGFEDGVIRTFETSTWAKTHTYKAHTKSVEDLTYSPCSNRLLSAGDDYTLHLWDCRANRSVYVVKDLPGEVSAPAFSPCGSQFALACAKGMVLLYDTRSGAVEHVWGCPEDKSYCISYSRNGQHITLGGSKGAIQRLNVNSGQIEQVVECTVAELRCMAISPDGQWAALAGGDRLQLLETATGKQGPSWRTPTGIKQVVFSPNGKSIATACDDMSVILWSTQTGVLLSAFPGHSSFLPKMAFSPNSVQLASGGGDGSVRLWDVTSSGTGYDSRQSSLGVSKVAYSPNGQSILSGHHDKTLRLYNADSGESSLILQGITHDFRSFAFSHDGLQVVTGDTDDTIRVWDVKTEECVLKFSDQEYVKTMVFSPHGGCIAVAGWSDLIKLLDTRSGTLHRSIENHDRVDGGRDPENLETLQQMFRDEVGPEGVIDMSNPRIRAINDAIGRYTAPDDILSLAFSSDGNRIVSGGEDGAVRIWDVETGKWRMLSWNNYQQVTQVEFSPKDKHVAFIPEDYGLHLWREQDTAPQHILEHKDIKAFAFSSCGDWITTTGGKVVLLWKKHVSDETVESWTCVATVSGFLGVTSGIAWRPGTLEFATGCYDGSVRTWQVEEDESRQVSVKQIWGVGLVTLAITDAVIDNVVGLSTINRKLLLQRGAKDGSASDDVLSESEEEIEEE